MTLSRILIVLLLAVLAYMVYVIMSCGDKSPTSTTTAAPAKAGASLAPESAASLAPEPAASLAQLPEVPVSTEASTQPSTQAFTNINYEHFENASGVTETVHGAAPFKNNEAVPDTQYATVKFSGLVDANPEDVLQIEGTDLLTAPLVDNMLYTNSIANTNRNASQDLRGDIPLQFNETYTPFYSSVIYGAPLSQHAMTISKTGTTA
jgi:hypothetical protein